MKELLVRALRDLGGRASRSQVRDRAIELGDFTKAELARQSAKPGMTQVEYQLGWALSQLKNEGRLANPQRGIWTTVD